LTAFQAEIVRKQVIKCGIRRVEFSQFTPKIKREQRNAICIPGLSVGAGFHGIANGQANTAVSH
jgi:hypothetical protein